MATLIQNVQDVCLELGLPSPSAAATSTDDQILQIVAMMNRVGDTLVTELDSQLLAKEYRFTTEYYQYTGNVTAGSSVITGLSSVAGLTDDFMVIGEGVMQDSAIAAVGVNTATMSIPATATATGVTLTFGRVRYDMPSDYERIVNKTQYNKSNRWAVIGPKDAQEWQWLKSSYITTGPRMRFRILGNQFVVWPMPAANVVLGLEYVSNAWVQANDGSYKTRFTADNDHALFPDRLMILGTKLKFFEIKGFDTSKLERDMARELSKWKSTEGGADTLSLAPRYANVLLTQNNLPDTGYGNTTS